MFLSPPNKIFLDVGSGANYCDITAIKHNNMVRWVYFMVEYCTGAFGIIVLFYHFSYDGLSTHVTAKMKVFPELDHVAILNTKMLS